MSKKQSVDTKEVAVRPQSPVVVADAAFAEYAGAGFENQTTDDYSIPFITVLQAMSPQVVERGSAAKAGMIHNSATGENYDGEDGLLFVPACTQHRFIHYRNRDAGGGLLGVYMPEDQFVQDACNGKPFGKILLDGGQTELVETFSVFGAYLSPLDRTIGQAVISFQSTKIKKYKQWMTRAKMIQLQLDGDRRIPAPLFSHRYMLTTVQEKNVKGTFYNVEISFDGKDAAEARLSPQDEIFKAAVALRDAINSGAAKVSYEAPEGGSEQTEEAPF